MYDERSPRRGEPGECDSLRLCSETRAISRLPNEVLVPDEWRIPDHRRVRSARLSEEEVGHIDSGHAASLGYGLASDAG
jgi:hypothetical protein